MANEKQDKYAERPCWLRSKKSSNGVTVVVFLTRAPLTLGHSQVIVDVNASRPEEELFNEAVLYIRAAMKTFESELPKVLNDEESTWGDLARWTDTRGKYLKTLILRSSASEKPEQPNKQSLLKVHLVPYFQSHADACYDRFHDNHSAPPYQRGGLLGWLGTQEDKVDKLEVDWPCETDKDKTAKEYFRLGELAAKLKDSAEKHFSHLKGAQEEKQTARRRQNKTRSNQAKSKQQKRRT